MNARTLALSAALSMAPGLAAAQEHRTWDTDGNALLDRADFIGGFRRSGLFAGWDKDDDGLVGTRELAEGLHDLWDVSGDGALTVGEWDRAADFWFGEEGADFPVSAWDADGDGLVRRTGSPRLSSAITLHHASMSRGTNC